MHHARYDKATMEGQTLEHLYSICRQCHEAATFDALGNKRTAAEREAMAVLLERSSVAVAAKPRKPRTRRRKLTIEEIRAASWRSNYGG